MAKLQIGMSESELEKINKILIKASATFQLAEGKRFNDKTTIIKIVEDWAANNNILVRNDEKEE